MDIVAILVVKRRLDKRRIKRATVKRGNKCDMPKPHGVKIFR